jgi:transcriptional regulator with XRE-family HTH domain
MDSDAKKIGDALDAAMNAYNGGRGIKQTSLSRLSGVPQGTISRTLSGKSIPETKTLSKLAAALGSDTFSNTLAAILPSQPAGKVEISSLLTPMFAMKCTKCGQVSHQSFVELEMNDKIACSCGASMIVAEYYGPAMLETILKGFGGNGMALRKR